MDKHHRSGTLDHRPQNVGSLLRLGLWMRASFGGAIVAAAGIASIVDPPHGVPMLTALTWMMAGGTFAWLSWQRASALLDRLDGSESVRGETRTASAMHPSGGVPELS